MNIHTHMHTHIRTYVHTYVHTCIYCSLEIYTCPRSGCLHHTPLRVYGMGFRVYGLGFSLVYTRPRWSCLEHTLMRVYGLGFRFGSLFFQHLPAFKLLWTHMNEGRDTSLKQAPVAAPVAAILHVKHLTTTTKRVSKQRSLRNKFVSRKMRKIRGS